jgi:hypothetical protein
MHTSSASSVLRRMRVGGLCACAGRFDFCLGSHNFKNGFFHFWVPCALLGCQKAPTSLHAPQCCYSHSLRRASAI